MTRSRINGNFIDKTFTIVANILLRIIPTTSGEKEAFTFNKEGMSPQSEGNYPEALQNNKEPMRQIGRAWCRERGKVRGLVSI
jgi:hypothetical protein